MVIYITVLITQTQDERKTKEYLDELEFLAETAGATVVKICVNIMYLQIIK